MKKRYHLCGCRSSYCLRNQCKHQCCEAIKHNLSSSALVVQQNCAFCWILDETKVLKSLAPSFPCRLIKYFPSLITTLGIGLSVVVLIVRREETSVNIWVYENYAVHFFCRSTNTQDNLTLCSAERECECSEQSHGFTGGGGAWLLSLKHCQLQQPSAEM